VFKMSVQIEVGDISPDQQRVAFELMSRVDTIVSDISALVEREEDSFIGLESNIQTAAEIFRKVQQHLDGMEAASEDGQEKSYSDFLEGFSTLMESRETDQDIKEESAPEPQSHETKEPTGETTIENADEATVEKVSDIEEEIDGLMDNQETQEVKNIA